MENLIALLLPLFQVLLTAILGGVLYRSGLLTNTTCQAFSLLLIKFFEPVYIFTKLLRFNDYGLVAKEIFFIIGLGAIFHCVCGSLLALVWCFFFEPSQHQDGELTTSRKLFCLNPGAIPVGFRYTLIACSAFGNAGDIPWSILANLGGSGIFTQDELDKGAIYIAIYCAVFNCFFYTWGNYLIAKDANEWNHMPHSFSGEEASVCSPAVSTPLMAADEEIVYNSNEPATAIHSASQSTLFPSLDQQVDTTNTYSPPPLSFHFQISFKWLKDFIKHILTTPVIVAVLAGLIITYTPLHFLFIGTPKGPFSPPLGFLTRLLETLAGGTIPIAMLNIGASLSRLSFKNQHLPALYVPILVIGHILLPIVGILLVCALYQGNAWIPSDITSDRMIGWVLLLEFSVPMAQSCLFLTIAYKGAEQYLTYVMVMSYCLCIVNLSLSISFGSTFIL